MKLPGLLNEIYAMLPLPGRAADSWVEFSRVNPEKATVILVSGFGATKRTLSVLRKRLIRDGFNVFVIGLEWKTFSEAFLGLLPVAHKIYSVVLRLRKMKGMQKSKIFIVAHSAGGLASRWYIQKLGGSHYCDGLVTLATPHRGTWVAALGFLSHLTLKARCLYQMLPSSKFIHAINEMPYPKNFPTLALSSDGDFLCPRHTTDLPETVHGNTNVLALEIEKTSHSEFLLSKQSYRLTISFLERLMTADSFSSVKEK